MYSEMLGVYTLDYTALANANRVTFPGGSLSFSYGGDPQFIPDMTWEDVKAFHDKYYHPSNCLVTLYGRLENPEAFLALLNSEFSRHEKAEFSQKDENYVRITEPVVTEFPYPMTEGTDPANLTSIYYYILCPGMKDDVAQEQLIDHVCQLLNLPSSPLQQAMRQTFPAAVISCGREVAAPDDAIVFVGSHLNREDTESFKALVDGVLKDAAENGFAQDMVDSAMASLTISRMLTPESGAPWDNVVQPIAYNYSVSGNPFRYMEDSESLDMMAEENAQGQLKDACARWMKDPALYTLTTTYPAPGEKEKADAALAAKLAEIKAGMSAEELQAIVDATHKESEPTDTTELLARLKAVTVESLPEEIKTWPVSDTTDENGIRHIEVTAAVDGIEKVSLLLDAAALPQEDIHWMRLYTRLLGKLDTEDHTRDELSVLMQRYMYDPVFGVNSVDLTESIHPYVTAEWTTLDQDLSAGYDLAAELLFRTKFDDTQQLTGLIDAQISYVRSQINQNAYSILLYRGLADRFPFYRFYNYMNFADYYQFLLQLQAQMAEQPGEVAEHLRKIQTFLANSDGAVTAFAGNAESTALNRPLADAFMAALPKESREPAEWNLPVPAGRDALIIDGNIQFNSVVATPDDLGLSEGDEGLNAVASLVKDTILIPVLRDGMGIYSVFNEFDRNGSMYLISYRDPNLRETFDVYASLADRIAGMAVDQDTLNGYIMSAYSTLATPAGELTGAYGTVQTVLEGRDPEEKLAQMRQLKAVTPETVKAAAELYRKAWENGYRGTAGSAAAIQSAADLYDNVLNPFNTQAAEKAEITDIGEDHAHYAGAVFAIDNGLMTLKEGGAFAPDDAATVGDFLGAMSVLFGLGGNDPAAARATFAQYGLVDAGLDLEAELKEDLLCSFLNTATGQQVMNTDTPDEVVPRGDLADLLKQLSGS